MDHVFLRCGLMAYLRAAKLGTVTGCMVTASHNAEPDNGVKICESAGDMMAAEWEPYAAELANLESTDAVVSWVEALAEQQGFALGSAAEVYVGMDTRPTSPHLTSLVVTGVEAWAPASSVHAALVLAQPSLLTRWTLPSSSPRPPCSHVAGDDDRGLNAGGACHPL